MLIDRENTGPKDITPNAIRAIKQILKEGFCYGTTPRNYKKYEDFLVNHWRLPSLNEIGGKVDLESGHISIRGIFSVVSDRDKVDAEDALIKGLTIGRGELYCYEHTLWSPQILGYAGSESYILRTTPKGKVQILQLNEFNDDEIVAETVEPKDIRRVALVGTGEYKVDKEGNILSEISEQKYSPKVIVDRLLAGQTVTRINIMGAPRSSAITDVVIIGSDNQLLERAIDWSSPANKYKVYA